MTFSEDLKIGQDIEKRVAEAMEKEWSVKALFPTAGKFSPFDFAFYTAHGDIMTVEVKFDKKAKETGNIAVEIHSNGSPSGISVTKSDYWVHVIGGNAHVVKTESLKTAVTHALGDGVKKHYKRTVNGGDGWNTRMVLFGKEILEEIKIQTLKI